MNISTLAGLAATFAFTSGAALADATFKMAPAGTGNAVDVTDDGSTVLLFGGGQARLWYPADDSIVVLGAVRNVGSIAPDGSYVVGSIEVGGKETAAYWTEADGWTSIGGLFEDGCDSFLSTGYDISDDGSVIVGLGWEGCSGRAFRWDSDSGEMVALPQDGPNSARANAVSGDGLVIGGWDEAATGFRRPAFWDAAGVVHVIDEVPGEVWGFSDDHSVMYGQANYENGTRGAIWADGKHTDLGLLPGQDPFFSASYVLASNADVSFVGGSSGGTFPGDLRHAYVWDAENGMQNLRDLLDGAGVESLPAVLWGVYGMTADGTTVVGGVPDMFGFSFDGFIATLPSESCDGDVDGSGAVDVNDLLAVLAAWGDCPGCPEDIDGDDMVGVSDLLIILAAWGDC